MGSHYLCVTPGGQMTVPTPEKFDQMLRSPKLKDVPSSIRRIVYGSGF